MKNPQLIVLDAQKAKQIALHANQRLMPERPPAPGELLPAGPSRPPQPVGAMSQPGAYRMPNQGPNTPFGAHPLPYGDALLQAPPENVNLAAPAGVQWKKVMAAAPQPMGLMDQLPQKPIQQVLESRGMPASDLPTPLAPAFNPFVTPQLQQQVNAEHAMHPVTGARYNPVAVPPSAPAMPPEQFGAWRPVMPPAPVGQTFEVQNQMAGQPIRRPGGVDDLSKGRPPAGKPLG